jgi:hypothetical protein
MMTHDQVFELLPLHALDALEGVELSEVESHLATCDICLAELALHHSVTATFVPDGPPPSRVWDRITAELDEEPSGAEVMSIESARAPKGTPLIWLTSIAALLALVLGVVAVFQQMIIRDFTGPDGIVTAAEEAAEQPGAIVADFETDDGTVAQVVLTPEGDGFVVPAESLAPLDEERTYQLWVITPDEQVISAGVLGNDPQPARFTWTGEVTGFALTRERAGGVVSSEGDVVSVIET